MFGKCCLSQSYISKDNIHIFQPANSTLIIKKKVEFVKQNKRDTYHKLIRDNLKIHSKRRKDSHLFCGKKKINDRRTKEKKPNWH